RRAGPGHPACAAALASDRGRACARPAAPRTRCAELTADQMEFRVTAMRCAANRLRLKIGAARPRPGAVHRIWILPETGPARALGVLAARGTQSLTLPPAAPDLLLAISRDPAGRPASGRPEGPILAAAILPAP
ncbi:anti-sigma factor domain-containing protein, partial [Roseivivax sp. CAU 1761]